MVKVNPNIKLFLKWIDMYGSKVQLNFQKEQTFKTFFGGCITLVILLLFCLTIWLFGQELYKRQNPTVIGQQRYVSSAKRVDINKNNLIIMMSIADSTSQPFIDPTIYSVNVVQEKLQITVNEQTGASQRKIVQINKDVKRCDSSDIGIPDLNSYFMKLNLTNFFCFPEEDFYMEGDFDADEFSQIYVYFKKCQNSTSSSVVCKPPDVINNALAQTKIQFYMSDKIVNPIDYDSPFTNEGINLYSPTSISYPQEVQIYFTNYYIESDTGLITESTETKQSFVYSSQQILSFFSDPNVLVRALFRLQKQKEIFMQRKYRKLADVIALVGGFLKVLTTVGALICSQYSKFCLNKAIIDEMFNFEYSKLPENDEDGNQKKIKANNEGGGTVLVKSEKNILNRNQSGDITDIFQCDISKQKQEDNNNPIKQLGFTRKPLQLQKCSEEISETFQQPQQNPTVFQGTESISARKLTAIEKAKQLFQTAKRVIKYSFKDKFFHVYFMRQKQGDERQQLVQEGISQIISHLDILFIMNKINEIDKLKNILLNADQLKLFEFIPKPIISINQQQSASILQKQDSSPLSIQRMYTLFNKEKTHEEKAIEAYQGLKNIVNKEQQSKIDYSLINILDNTIFNQLKLKRDDPQPMVSQNNSPFLSFFRQSLMFGDEKEITLNKTQKRYDFPEQIQHGNQQTEQQVQSVQLQ